MEALPPQTLDALLEDSSPCGSGPVPVPNFLFRFFFVVVVVVWKNLKKYDLFFFTEKNIQIWRKKPKKYLVFFQIRFFSHLIKSSFFTFSVVGATTTSSFLSLVSGGPFPVTFAFPVETEVVVVLLAWWFAEHEWTCSDCFVPALPVPTEFLSFRKWVTVPT